MSDTVLITTTDEAVLSRIELGDTGQVVVDALQGVHVATMGPAGDFHRRRP